MSPTPHTSLRWRIVMCSTMAAILAVVWQCPSYGALPWIGLILLASGVALPSPIWLRVRDFCRWVPWALDSKLRKPAAAAPAVPEDPEDAAQRRRYELDLAEYDTRVQIGMPMGHPERLAYNLEGPLLALDRSERGRNAGQWHDLEARTWQDGEWVDVIDEVRREQGWKQ